MKRSAVLVSAFGLAFALGLCAAPASAKLVRLEIASKQPYGSFKAGDYVLWQGRVVGELSPDEPIPDLAKAAKNARGMVEYAAKVSLFMPADPTKSNGALLVDVPNRGRVYAHALYNSPRDEPFQSGTFEPGTGFLEDRGFIVAEVHWELGQGAELPSFTDEAGKTRHVEGVGFAIMRDAADFLARSPADSAGTPNPIRGTVSRVLASGKSQTGRFLKTFLLHGFNTVEGRRVFDGMHIFVSGAGLLPIMQAGTGPESSGNRAPNFADPEMRGVHEDPLTIGGIVERVEGRGEVPPKIAMINTVTDYFSIRASLSRTGADGTADLPFPPNVRVYDIAGSSHVTVVKTECKLPPARLDWTPVSRATLLRLDAWVRSNAEPPPTTLMPLEPAGEDPTVLRAPAHLPKAVIQVPQRDADGNVLGGVRLPDLAVPLGTHAKQNEPLATFGCSLVGAWAPFAAAKEEREAAHDPRPSLKERYKDRTDYANRVRVAARALEAQGFLLREDAAIIIQAAAANQLLK